LQLSFVNFILTSLVLDGASGQTLPLGNLIGEVKEADAIDFFYDNDDWLYSSPPAPLKNHKLSREERVELYKKLISKPLAEDLMNVAGAIATKKLIELDLNKNDDAATIWFEIRSDLLKTPSELRKLTRASISNRIKQILSGGD